MALAYAGISVYPVDVRGTLTASPQSTMAERMIAQRSGGIAYVDNDVRGAIDQAMRDSEVSYTLGFYPDRAPDRVNAIKIEMRQKGLGAGYRAAHSGLGGGGGEGKSPMEVALASPLDATQVRLDARLTREGAGWAVWLELDPREVTFEKKDGRFAGRVEIALRQLTAEGGGLGTKVTTAELAFDAADYQEFLGKTHVVKLLIPNPSERLASGVAADCDLIE